MTYSILAPSTEYISKLNNLSESKYSHIVLCVDLIVVIDRPKIKGQPQIPWSEASYSDSQKT